MVVTDILAIGDAPGGRRKVSVPFTWIVKLRNVMPVHWLKQASKRRQALKSRRKQNKVVCTLLPTSSL